MSSNNNNAFSNPFNNFKNPESFKKNKYLGFSITNNSHWYAYYIFLSKTRFRLYKYERQCPIYDRWYKNSKST